MTTYHTTIDNKKVKNGFMSPKEVLEYCTQHGLVKPDVYLVSINADFVHRRLFNWEKQEYEREGGDYDHMGML